MKKVKITTLEITFDQGLADEYGIGGLPTCPMVEEGQVFYGDYAKPEGSCDKAWEAIYQYVSALFHGSGRELLYYGDWTREPGVAVCSCNDGLCPIIFKPEVADQESQMDCEPVRQSIFGV